MDKTSARTDREVLITLGQYSEPDIYGWGSDKPLGDWPGVTTDSNGRVTEIETSLSLTTEGNPLLPRELGNLAYLEVLRIYSDSNARSIPAELGNLANLKVLYLSGVWSEIPAELGNLANLQSLHLSGDLYGEIPAELGNLANLEVLELRDYPILSRGLSGEIPAELGNLANLEVLSLSGDLSGEIPAELGNLANLQSLALDAGGLSGEIPAELGNLANLKALLLPDGLSGCVPFELRDQGTYYSDRYDSCIDPRVTAEQMPVLTALYDATGGDDWYDNTNWLSDAELGEWYGVTTDDEGYITGLKLYENDLSGEIPAELGQLARLQSLYLYGNSLLTGCIPASLEDQLTDTELGGLSYCGQ